ncbi:hypothetical protein AK812_SmicGene3624 [Symbiodinium microadriaticum]|uniref:Uncharacterized protein n=1 Tax=Symbiodinium microadriaticum TaxID=2951 RepID=A0A1Q9EYG1_SYMMI|nr:hypothetical protein AK812_SmicGene3624 [Symbiodinium microadriaticum]
MFRMKGLAAWQEILASQSAPYVLDLVDALDGEGVSCMVTVDCRGAPDLQRQAKHFDMLAAENQKVQQELSEIQGMMDEGFAKTQAGSSQHLAKIFEMESIHLDKKIQYALSCLFDTEV